MTAKSAYKIAIIVIMGMFLLSASTYFYLFSESYTKEKQLETINNLTRVSTNIAYEFRALSQLSRMYLYTQEEQWIKKFKIRLDSLTNGKNLIKYNIEKKQQKKSNKVFVQNNVEYKKWPIISDLFSEIDLTEKDSNTLSELFNKLIQLSHSEYKKLHSLSKKNKNYTNNSNNFETDIDEAIHTYTSFVSKVVSQKSMFLDEKNVHIEFIHGLLLFFYILTFVSILVTAKFLKKRYIAPLSMLQKHVKNSNIKRINLEKLPNTITGELGFLVDYFKTVVSVYNAKIDSSIKIKQFNTAIRGIHKTSKVITETLEFVALNFNSPSCAVFLNEDGALNLHETLGHSPLINEQSALSLALLKSNKRQILTASKNSELSIRVNDQYFIIHEVHLVPLLINDQCIGAFYLAQTSRLEEADLVSLEEICHELALAIKLSSSIDKQRAIENALSEQLELNHHIINAIPNPTYYRDNSGCFMGVNKAFLNFIDKFEAEVIDAPLEVIFEPDTAHLFAQQAEKMFASQNDIEYNLITTDGQGLPVELVVYEAPFFDNQSKIIGIVGMFLDVSKRNELERQLLEAKEVADYSAQVKGEFLANMSHEIRTPMNAIIGMTHLALASELNDKQYNYVNKIDIAAKQLLRLINDILDISKIESGKIEIEQTAFDLDELIETVQTIVSVKAEEKKLQLNFDVKNLHTTHFIGDPLRISQVLINLVGNAVKFTEQGNVTIQIHITLLDEDNVQLRISVKDTGIGMDVDQQKKLFQSFSQADTSITRKYGGTGLGLTISQQLVKLMQSEIYVESSVGKGSEFYFDLSLPIDKSKPRNQIRIPISEITHIHLIDDDDESTFILETLLIGIGLKNIKQTSVMQLISDFDKNTDSLDLIFISWPMLLKHIDLFFNTLISLEKNNFKVIITTSSSNDISLNNEQTSCISDIIQKPIKANNLVKVISKHFILPVKKHTKSNHQYSKNTLNTMTILLAEDQPVNQEIASEILSNYGAVIDIANNGREALEMVALQKYDILLMDMQMPELDGISATIQIRKQFTAKKLPIIAMTANAMEEDIDNCLKAGMNDHVAKPINVDALISTILQCYNESNNKKSQPITEPLIHELNPEFEQNKPAAKLEGINISEGVNRASGNKDIYFKILIKFLHQQVEELINLKQAIAIQNFDLAANIIHALKGTAANLSVDFLTEHSKTLEQQLLNQNVDMSCIDEMIDYVKRTYEIIHDYQGSESDFSSSVSSADQLETLLKLSSALQEFDTSANDIVGQLVESEYLNQQNLDKIQHLINQFEFEQALNILTQCKGINFAKNRDN